MMNYREIWSSGAELYLRCLMDLKRVDGRNTIDPTNASSNGFSGRNAPSVGSSNYETAAMRPAVYCPLPAMVYGDSNYFNPQNYQQQQQQRQPQLYASQVACPTPIYPSAHPIAYANTFVDPGAGYRVIDESVAVSSTDEKSKATESSKVRRPMNAFMLFAKRHRHVVREYYPNYDNRTVSKILSEWWYAWSADCKRQYREMAEEIKSNHYRDHPAFKWKTSPPSSSLSAGESKSAKAATAKCRVSSGRRAVKRKSTTPDSSDCVKRFAPDSIGGKMNEMVCQQSTVTSGQTDRGNGTRKPETVFTETPTPATMPFGSDAQSSLCDRFHSLPKFDCGNYQSPTQWTTFDVRNQRSQAMQRATEVNQFGTFVNKVTKSPASDASGSKMVKFQSRKEVIMNLFNEFGMYPSPQHIFAVLTEHGDLFGNNQAFLNLKIREFRQKLLNGNKQQQN